MKKSLTTGFCLLLGLSLLAGCSGGGTAVQSLGSPPPHSPPPSSTLTLVNPPPVPPQGNVGVPFGIDLVSWTVGGVQPITVSLKSGTLPAGLTLSSSGGVVTGLPTAVSATTVVFTVTDSEKPPSSVHVSILITINAMLPLGITPASGALPGGTVGVWYLYVCHARCGCPLITSRSASGPLLQCHRSISHGFQIDATGGVWPYMFNWAAASRSLLPPGMSFSNGLIDGTPTTAGTYNFVVTATDSESPPKQATANYSITVAPAPSPSPSSSP